MIIINADGLQDGLYNIKDGQIFKYKAKGGTVRTYEMGEVVRCKDCRFSETYQNDSSGAMALYCKAFTFQRVVADDDFCSFGERREP